MAEPPDKRRKLRKGTHSCWECRRRKIKCILENPEDTVCKPCVARGSSCISQEEIVEPLSPAEGGLAQRLGRLERMVEQVLEHTVLPAQAQADRALQTPSETQSSRAGSQDVSSSTPSLTAHLVDLPTIAEDAPHGGPEDISKSCYAMSPQERLLRLHALRDDALKSTPRWTQYATISQHIYDLFPPRETREILAHQSPGASNILAVFCTRIVPTESSPEPPSALIDIPPVTSHPAILAKRLVQLAICLQQLPPTINTSLGPGNGPAANAAAQAWISAVAILVTGNDALIGCLEGIECLILQTYYRMGAGQLRKGWMDARRALNTAQLLGIDRLSQEVSSTGSVRQIPSCDAERCAPYWPRADSVWFRINCNDRYLSITLGLPIGSRDNSFATAEVMAHDTPEIRLGKSYAIITSKLADRNNAADSGKAAEAYALTQEMDLDLERAARVMKDPWWQVPNMTVRNLDGFGASMYVAPMTGLYQQPSAPAGVSNDTVIAAMTLQTQIRHYMLLILVHLPYLLREREGRRYEYNRTTCMQASRAVLERFLTFRGVFTLAVAGRPTDYAGLVAAATLLLGHLPRRREEGGGSLVNHEDDAARESDQALAEAYRHKMCELAALNSDRMTAEAAEVIAHLLPLAIRSPCESGGGDDDPNHWAHGRFMGGLRAPPGATQAGPTDRYSAIFKDYGVSGAFPIGQGKCAILNRNQHSDGSTGFPTDAWPGMEIDLEDSGLQGIEMVYWTMVRGGMT